MSRNKLDVVWDMETQDPDDFITLLLLLGHPRVRLKAVPVTPGSPYQIGLVRRALQWFDAKIPVGAYNIDHPKPCVSSWHYQAYGEVPPSREAAPGAEILRRFCNEETTLITGGPLKNLGAAIKQEGFRVGRLVAQGGFAGEGVVPEERQLPKFKGLATCATFNLNGDPKAALAALSYPGIGVRRFVSKNVCHGVVYDLDMHRRIAKIKDGSRSLELIWQGMDAYLQQAQEKRRVIHADEQIGAPEVLLIGKDGEKLGVKAISEALALAREKGLTLVEVSPEETPPVCRLLPQSQLPSIPESEGKKLHDPLAACCAIDEAIGLWAEVELYREKGKWGSRLSPGSGTWIITGYDPERFFQVLTERV